MGGKTLRCVNHPERLAVGICNDCGKNFCSGCLHIYHLETQDAQAVLYLDESCLRRRHSKKVSEAFLGGIALIAFGLFFSIFALFSSFALLTGIFFIILGVSAIAYGFFKGGETPVEPTLDETVVERKQTLNAYADKLHDELVSAYVYKWGPRIGIDLLQHEIKAYMRQGISFPEAVKRIHARTHKI